MRAHNKLTPLGIAKLKAPGKYADGLGLYLFIVRPGEKFWCFRYMIDGKARQLGLGPLHSVSLQEARERARQARQCILDGGDPIRLKHEARTAARVEQLRTMTFEQAATQFLATDRIEGFKNAKHRAQWKSTLESYAYPVFGSLPLQSIDSAIVLKALAPVWRRAPETGSRLRQRIEAVINWAKPLGLYVGDNPAGREILKDHLPAKRKVEHHKALSYSDLPAFMARLRERDNVSAKALEFLTLTASRTGEVIGAQWSEVDLAAATWTIPGSRMKAGVEHVVPLSPRAVEILRSLPTSAGFIFLNGGGAPISNMAMLQLMKGMGVDATPHGMRSAFNTWAKNMTNYAPETRNAALAHTEEKLEQAYTRDKNQLMLAKRARLMVEWARYLAGHAVAADKVTAICSA
jgi:integrase